MTILLTQEIVNDIVWDGAQNISTTSVNIPSGTNQVVVLLASNHDNLVVEVGGVSMPELAERGDGDTSYVFGFAAAPSTTGVQDLTIVSPVAARAIGGTVFCLSETTYVAPFSANAYSATPSVTATTEADDLVLDIINFMGASTAATVGSGQTELINTTSTWKTDARFASSSEVATTTSTVMDWSLSPSERWASLALVFRGTAPSGGSITGVTSVTLGGEPLTIVSAP